MNTLSRLAMRLFQAEQVDEIVTNRDRDASLEGPCGSGKTFVVAVSLCEAFRLNFAHHALILAPQVQIEEGFVACSGLEVSWPDAKPYRRRKTIVIPENFIASARGNSGSLSKKILDYLLSGKPNYAFPCTHLSVASLLQILEGTDLLSDLSGYILVIDEAHHVAAKGLSKFIAFWKSRGGRVIQSTASPFRGDGLCVHLDGMLVIRRSLAEHAAEGFAPENIENELVPIGDARDKVTSAEFSGESVGKDSRRINQLVKAIVARWEAHGRPKTIVRVPPMAGGSRRLVEALAKKLRKVGARVYDASGVGVDRRDAFVEMLHSESNATFKSSQWDVVVGVQRVLEGTNWPVCSTVYCVGIPGSLTAVVQLLGRALRKKDNRHPDKDVARITFFVPTAGGKALERLPLEHSRRAFLTCVVLSDHKAGAEWIINQAIGGGWKVTAKDRGKKKVARPEYVSPDIHAMAEAKLFMAEAVEKKKKITVQELMAYVRKAMPDIADEVIDAAIMEVLATEGGSLGAKVVNSIKAKVAKHKKRRSGATPEMQGIFKEMVDEFRDQTLTKMVGLRAIGAQLHSLTCGGIEDITRRLREANDRGGPLMEEMIIKWASEHKKRTGRWPNAGSGEIPLAGGLNWAAVNESLRCGFRGLKGGSSVSQFIAENFGSMSNRSGKQKLTEDLICKWARSWKESIGSWPTQRSGEIPQSNGENWGAVSLALLSGTRGLTGGSSLARLLKERFGVRNKADLPSLSVEILREWVEKWFFKTGTYPLFDSGNIPDTNGETWVSVHGALKNGRRGFPGGSSLFQFIRENFKSFRRTRRFVPKSSASHYSKDSHS